MYRLFLLVSFLFVSCSENTVEGKDDYQSPDNDIASDAAESDADSILLDDSDAAVGHPPRWTITEEDIPWVKDGVLQYYQWGTAHADNVSRVEYQNKKIYLAGSIGGKLDHSVTSDSYLKIITDDKKMKTYTWGTDKSDIVSTFTMGADGKLYIAGLTDGDMGKIWGKTGYANNDCVVTILDTTNDSFSFIQWGNDNFCIPRALYLEDDGTLVVIGVTNAAFPGQTLHGKTDIFISRIKGKDITTTQFGQQPGNVTNPCGKIIKTDSQVFIYGDTNSALPGQTFKGGQIDGFIIAIDRKAYAPVKYHQIGTDGDDGLSGIALAPDNKIHFIGSTSGSFSGFANKGEMDFFYGHLENDTVVIDNMAGTAGDDLADSLYYHDDYIFHSGSTGGNCDGEGGVLPSDDIVFVSLSADYKIKKCFHWGSFRLDSGGGLAVTPEGRIYLGVRTYGVLGSQFFGDEASDSWDAALLTTTLSDLGL